jgi:succinate dehydrogenase/fumarate reductase flavoprotein subunit
MPESEVLVVGGGVAGLRAALAAKEAGARVALLSKTHPLRSHSAASPGGLNAALDPEDSTEIHVRESAHAGGNLCDLSALAAMCREAPQEAVRLDRWGAPFNRNADGQLATRRLNVGKAPRAVFAADFTGHVVLHTLYEQALKEQIPTYDEWVVTSLLIEEGQCRGVLALELRTGQLAAFTAPAVILATGGAGRLYRRSTASQSCTGDGMSLAYRAGVRLVNMEMVQYHPLGFPTRRAFASEATLAEGAMLHAKAGQPVFQVNDPLTRDYLSRFMVAKIKEQGGDDCLFLDLRPLGTEALSSRFSHLCRIAKDLANIKLDQESLPVRPLAHRLLGGIEATLDGATSLPGLFACGECACPGTHGANALAGNALTANVVFGRRAGAAAAIHARAASPLSAADSRLREEQQRLAALFSRNAAEDTVTQIYRHLSTLMDEHVGLVRDENGLTAAAQELAVLKQRHDRVGLRHQGKVYNTELLSLLELGSLLDVAEAVIAAARTRKESRGVHQRNDFPMTNDEEWRQYTCVSRGNGDPTVETRPVTSHLSP